MKKVECFKIRLACLNGDIWDIRNSKEIHTVSFEFPTINDNPVVIVADPFLFVSRDVLYLFYERKRLKSNGEIMMEKTNDLVHWTKPVTVLKEKNHLSFPYVFEDDEKIYMIPESSRDYSIRLYEADTERLDHFVMKGELLRDINPTGKKFSYSDSVLKKIDNVYYLFTSYRNMEDVDVAELYYSYNILGPYNLHPSSPISTDSKQSRCAGSLLTSPEGGLVRLVQDCENEYGKNVNGRLIDTISTIQYKESDAFFNIIPRNMHFYRKGGHHYSYVEYKGNRIIATDAKDYHRYIVSRTHGKVKRIVGHE